MINQRYFEGDYFASIQSALRRNRKLINLFLISYCSVPVVLVCNETSGCRRDFFVFLFFFREIADNRQNPSLFSTLVGTTGVPIDET